LSGTANQLPWNKKHHELYFFFVFERNMPHQPLARFCSFKRHQACRQRRQRRQQRRQQQLQIKRPQSSHGPVAVVLCIDIEYEAYAARNIWPALSGCHADAHTMQRLWRTWLPPECALIWIRATDAKDATDATDAKDAKDASASPGLVFPATRAGIEAAAACWFAHLERFCRHDAKSVYAGWFYSGHGNQLPAWLALSEADGKDEAMVPADALERGVLRDNWWHDRLASCLPAQLATCVWAVCDSCHSGTMFDLPWQWEASTSEWSCTSASSSRIRAPLCLVSACTDTQLASSSRQNTSGEWHGVLTAALDQATRAHPGWTPDVLWRQGPSALTLLIPDGAPPQTVTLTASCLPNASCCDKSATA